MIAQFSVFEFQAQFKSSHMQVQGFPNGDIFPKWRDKLRVVLSKQGTSCQ